MIVFERVVAFIVIGFMVWQFAIPMIFGIPLFPLFRRKAPEAAVLTEISEAKRTLMIDELRHELAELRHRHEDDTKADEKETKNAE